jgi:hypothetical protein
LSIRYASSTLSQAPLCPVHGCIKCRIGCRPHPDAEEQWPRKTDTFHLTKTSRIRSKLRHGWKEVVDCYLRLEKTKKVPTGWWFLVVYRQWNRKRTPDYKDG